MRYPFINTNNESFFQSVQLWCGYLRPNKIEVPSEIIHPYKRGTKLYSAGERAGAAGGKRAQLQAGCGCDLGSTLGGSDESSPQAEKPHGDVVD